MSESDERLTRLIENQVYDIYVEWAGRYDTDPLPLNPPVHPRAGMTDLGDYGDGQPMHVELDGYGLFEISVSVKRLPGGNRWRECAQCNSARHTCPGCGEDIEHGQTDCGAHDEEAPKEADIPAVQLTEGDEIFSPATGQWHKVIEAGTHGTTTLVIDRNNGSTFQFKVRPEQTFKARRGPAGSAVDALGGEVIHSA